VQGKGNAATMSYPLSHTRKQAHIHGILSPLQRKKRLSHIPTISPNFDTNYIFVEN
jgi:hypothetical protein